MLDKFAEELRAAREKTGLTIEQMAAKTRIDKKFIEAIDNGNFSFLPELYVRAFLKEYANLVGLDPEETLKKFKAVSEGIEPEVIPEEKVSAQPTPTQASPKKHRIYLDRSVESGSNEQKSVNKNLYIYSGTGFILFLLMAFVYFFFIRSEPDIVVKEKPYEEVVNNNPQRFVVEEPQRDKDQGSSILSSDSLLLTISSSGTSWVQVISDEKVLSEFTLFPSSSKSLKAVNNYECILGNSANINLKLNNRQLNFAGEPGKVRYVKIDSSGLQYLNYRPTLKQN